MLPHDLDTVSPFKALSYTWGVPYQHYLTKTPEFSVEQIRHVVINEELITVTQNLYDALMRVNKLTTPTFSVYLNNFLWVDALCINQSDLAERATQVALMGSLYTATEEVLIWLDPEHEYFPDFSMAIS